MSVLTAIEKEKIIANKGIYDDFDPAFTEAFVRHVMSLVNDVYFRIKYIGFEESIERNNPDAPVIIVSNHSGRSIPWDAMAFMSGLLRQFNYDASKVCRTLIVPTLSTLGPMVPYFIPNFWKKCGGIDASFHNFETMMHYPNANLMLYPEGVPGIGKGWNHKYELQAFSTSFIKMSLKYNTDIVPFATVNAEYVNPYMYNIPWVNRVMKKLFGIPFLPIGVLTLLLLMPWAYYFTFPAKMTFVRGKRIKRTELSDKAYHEIEQEEIEAIRDEVQNQMQTELNEAVDTHGETPYNWREFFKIVWQNRKYFPYYIPVTWPFLFSEFYLQWKKGEEIKMNYSWWNLIRLIWKRPLILAYFIPILGWIPIMILSKKEAHLKEN